jgi:arsenite methyltransferase
MMNEIENDRIRHVVRERYARVSSCVIKLSPDKPRVFAEAYRVLKPGGRLAISDVVAMGELPEPLRKDETLYAGCVGGAVSIPEPTAMLEMSGFTDIHIRSFIRDRVPGTAIEDFVVSTTIEAVKPAT